MVPDTGPFQQGKTTISRTRTTWPHADAERATPQGQVPPVTVPAGYWGGLRTLLGGKAERFGMGPPVVLGQRLAEGADR